MIAQSAVRPRALTETIMQKILLSAGLMALAATTARSAWLQW
jgi:hypothetical protein